MATPAGTDTRSRRDAVVFIHGAGMDSTVWRLQVDALAQHHHRPRALDLPAHGRSDGPALTSIEAMAEWVAVVVEAIVDEAAGVEAVHVVGHSMGTYVALELAVRRPTLVRSLILCGTSTSMPVNPGLLDAADHDLPTAAAMMAKWSHAHPTHDGPEPSAHVRLIDEARALVERSAPGVLASDLRACIAYDHALAAAAAVSCPATVVIGLGDKMTPPEGGRALAAALPAARVVQLADTGHSMMAEHPVDVQQAILDTITH
jgi:pimeloyl-ACP methyl ester carboxylesterase